MATDQAHQRSRNRTDRPDLFEAIYLPLAKRLGSDLVNASMSAAAHTLPGEGATPRGLVIEESLQLPDGYALIAFYHVNGCNFSISRVGGSLSVDVLEEGERINLFTGTFPVNTPAHWLAGDTIHLLSFNGAEKAELDCGTASFKTMPVHEGQAGRCTRFLGGAQDGGHTFAMAVLDGKHTICRIADDSQRTLIPLCESVSGSPMCFADGKLLVVGYTPIPHLDVYAWEDDRLALQTSVPVPFQPVNSFPANDGVYFSSFQKLYKLSFAYELLFEADIAQCLHFSSHRHPVVHFSEGTDASSFWIGKVFSNSIYRVSLKK